MKGTLLLIQITLSIGVFWISGGCKNGFVRDDDNNLEYYHLPKLNAYYGVEKRTYFYSVDGGSSWDSISAPFNKDNAALSSKQVIYSNTNDVWKDNAAHRKMYNGVLIAIVTKNDEVPTTEEEVTERKVVKKKTVTPKKKVVPRQERGFRKFLNNVFKKKKKY